VLRGVVANRTVDAGAWNERRFVVLEKEPGGQFLALHAADGSRLETSDFLGKWVEVEGALWFQSLTASSIKEISGPGTPVD
jgi:hypothetical protein